MAAPRALLLLALVPALAFAPTLDPASPLAGFAAHALADERDAPDGVVSWGAEPTVGVAADGTVLVGDTSGLRRSADDGASWSRSPNPFLPGLFGDGWTFAFDDAGTLYAATTQGQAIGVASSADRGASWRFTAHVVGAGGVADRPWLAANEAGHVALVWYQAGAGEWCAASRDGGVTWTERSAHRIGFSNAGNLVLDDAGDLWYATDYGIHRWKGGCLGEYETALLPLSGAQIFTQLALTPSGDAFVAQPTAGNGAMELRGMHGLDAATAKRLVVSPPGARSNTFGAVATLGDDEVAVAWYGSATPGNPSISTFKGDWRLHVARVTGFWTDAPVVDLYVAPDVNHKGWFCMSGVTCSGGRALLDYFGVAYAKDGTLHVAYGHDASGRPEVRHEQLPRSA